MDWIESHKAIMYHRKTGRLMRALSISRLEAVGMVHGLWWWCVDNAQDGDLNDVDPQDVADWCCWPGDAGDMVDALRQSGWITGDGHINDWDDFAGKLIDRQVAERKRKRDARLRLQSETGEGSPQDVRRTDDGSPTVDFGTEQDHTIPLNTSPARAHETNGSNVPGQTNMPSQVQADIALFDQLKQAATDLLDKKLPKAHVEKLQGWFTQYKRRLTLEIIAYGKEQTAGHTNGKSLDYFTEVMRRKIEEPHKGKPTKNGSGPSPPDLRGPTPPEGYSWVRNDAHEFVLLVKDAVTGLYPMGVESAVESKKLEDAARLEYIRKRDQPMNGVGA